MGTESSSGTQGSTTTPTTTGSSTDPGGSSSSTTDVPTGTSSNSDSGTGSTGVPDPTSSGTTSDTTGGVSASSSSGSSTTDSDLCMTILCGNPAACCLDTEECVGGACVAICDSGVRCGANQENCCDSGDVCVGESCTTPGAACKDSYDCPPNNYCESVLGKCLPQPDGLSCVDKVTFDKVEIGKATAYAAEDADVTLRLWQLLKPRLVAERRATVYETLERPLIDVIARMERCGIMVDRQILSRLSGDFSQIGSKAAFMAPPTREGFISSKLLLADFTRASTRA